MLRNNWAKALSHKFFSYFIKEMYNDGIERGHWTWFYHRFKQTDQYFEDLFDLLGTYCMGGEL